MNQVKGKTSRMKSFCLRLRSKGCYLSLTLKCWLNPPWEAHKVKTKKPPESYSNFVGKPYTLQPFSLIFDIIFDRHSISNDKALSITTTWIVDTGASDHMYCIQRLFQSLKLIQNLFVNLLDGTRIPITHIGTIKI